MLKTLTRLGGLARPACEDAVHSKILFTFWILCLRIVVLMGSCCCEIEIDRE